MTCQCWCHMHACYQPFQTPRPKLKPDQTSVLSMHAWWPTVMRNVRAALVAAACSVSIMPRADTLLRVLQAAAASGSNQLLMEDDATAFDFVMVS